MKYMTLRLAAAAGLVLLASGCAFSTPHVYLDYQPDPTAANPLSEIKPMSIALQVEDKRAPSERDRVGDKINGYGSVTAKVLTDKDVAAIINDAFTAELEHDGHKVVTAVDQNSPPADATIHVAVTRCWSESKVHFWDIEMVGTIAADLEVSGGPTNAVPLTRSLAGTYRVSRQIVTDKDFEKILNRALVEFMHNFVLDPAISSALRQRQPG